MLRVMRKLLQDLRAPYKKCAKQHHLTMQGFCVCAV